MVHACEQKGKKRASAFRGTLTSGLSFSTNSFHVIPSWVIEGMFVSKTRPGGEIFDARSMWGAIEILTV